MPESSRDYKHVTVDIIIFNFKKHMHGGRVQLLPQQSAGSCSAMQLCVQRIRSLHAWCHFRKGRKRQAQLLAP